MAVTNDTIMQKMRHELTEAQNGSHNEATMKKHVANIQLLCDLLLDEQNDTANEKPVTRDISTDEMKAMMGDNKVKKPSEPVNKSLDDDEANGDSLFDF